MAKIYIITNNINEKSYIGWTSLSLEERLKNHIKDSKNRKYEKRPLYSAMNKYGADKFHIELIEETDNPQEREIYWIEQYNSYHCGYNATKGGDGKSLIDFEYAKKRYEEVQNLVLVAKEMNIDTKHLGQVLREMGVQTLTSIEVNRRDRSKIVNQYDLKDNFIQSFPSAIDAARFLGKITSTSKGASSHITDVCRGKQKSAYGYKWKFAE